MIFGEISFTNLKENIPAVILLQELKINSRLRILCAHFVKNARISNLYFELILKFNQLMLQALAFENFMFNSGLNSSSLSALRQSEISIILQSRFR